MALDLGALNRRQLENRLARQTAAGHGNRTAALQAALDQLGGKVEAGGGQARPATSWDRRIAASEANTRARIDAGRQAHGQNMADQFGHLLTPENLAALEMDPATAAAQLTPTQVSALYRVAAGRQIAAQVAASDLYKQQVAESPLGQQIGYQFVPTPPAGAAGVPAWWQPEMGAETYSAGWQPRLPAAVEYSRDPEMWALYQQFLRQFERPERAAGPVSAAGGPRQTAAKGPQTWPRPEVG